MDDDAPLTLPALGERVEAVSALYARKFGVDRDPDWFMLKFTEEVGELTQAFLAATGRTRPRGGAGTSGPDGGASPLADEVADVLAHLLLLARSQGVDVEAAVRRMARVGGRPARAAAAAQSLGWRRDRPPHRPPVAADEVTTLRGFLDFHRDTLRWKTSGLDAAELAHRLRPSSMTLGGLLKHLAFVESQWFSQVLLGEALISPFDTADWADDRDWDWTSAAGDSPD